MTIAEHERSFWSAKSWPLVFALAILFATLIPSWNIGFVCEDYCHLVEETARLPLISSFDGLHRPLRNIVLKAAYGLFGLNSAPYHVTIIFLHLAAVVLLYRFMLRLEGSRIAALAAAVLFGFFPRNHQAVFWVSVGVDSVVAICALMACSAFLDYLERGRIRSYLVALFSFVCALGFKETGVAIVPLLLLVQVTCTTRRSSFSFRRAALLYLPFVIVGVVFALWVAGFFGRADVAQSFYGVQSASQAIKMAIKFLINMALPFAAPVEARDLLHNLPLITALVFILLGASFAACILVARNRLLFACGWVLVSMGPTAVFGFYNDRYLSLPFIGVAILLGFLAEGLIYRLPNRTMMQAAVAIVLCAYVAASVVRLVHYERSWAAAGQEIRNTMEATRRIYPYVPNGTVFTFVNLTHSREKGQIYIFNVGLNGTLWAWGYDTSVTAQRTFASTDPREKQLMREVLRCEKETPPQSSDHRILLVADGVKDVSGACARRIVEVSRQQEPELWK